MNNKIFVLVYIHTDCIEYSEVLGLYYDKDEVIDDLIEYAHYRVDEFGRLTHYFHPTDQYKSIHELRTAIENDMELKDVDLYIKYLNIL